MAGPSKDRSDVRTTCPYCGVGCGVIVTPDGQGGASVRGDPLHPANKGRLCSKGSALGETLDLDERLLKPRVNGAEVEWDKALDHVAQRFRSTIAEHGPDSVAFYVSGQLLTEDYYVANKLMKGFIGSGNIDTNSRLCMASSVAGHKRAFGADTVPGCYEDLEKADLVVLVGSNSAWCHPVLHQRILAAKSERGSKLVVIDPRQTATTDAADLHLAIKPGADVALFNTLFSFLAKSAARNDDYINAHTSGLDEALLAAEAIELEEVSRQTGLSLEKIGTFLDWFSDHERTVTVYSQGVNQSSAGADKVNAIINCHLVTGRIGQEGMGPFSITGQPNAMGGREVGGLANQLAAHMDFAPADVDRVGRFWNAEQMASQPGLKAVDMFDAVEDGRIKAIWVMATNPVISMPDANRVKRALEDCPFVVVSDVVTTSDTLKLGHVQLPATAWGEKTGTVTNSERCISRQRSFLKPPGQARHDWDIVSDVARRMGFSGFDYQSEAEIYREHCELTSFENAGQRDLDLGIHQTIEQNAFDALEPFYWPAKSGPQTQVRHLSTKRFFAKGGYYTPDGRGRFIATPLRAPSSKPDSQHAFVMNTGRVRDHWHTMTRTGKTSRLSAHIGEPFLEIHPEDAALLGLADAALAEVKTTRGCAILRGLVTDRVRRGECFAPFHWTSRYASHGRVDALIASNVDPVSGQPEAKYTPVSIKPLSVDWYGVAFSRSEPGDELTSKLSYWSKARNAGGWTLEFAGRDNVCSAEAMAKLLLGASKNMASYDDVSLGKLHRAAFDVEGQLNRVCFINRSVPAFADRGWLSAQLGSMPDTHTRMAILAGRPPSGEGSGRTVCSCFGVGVNALKRAAWDGANTVEEIGEKTCAGTNCGSCKSEIDAMLASLSVEKATSSESVVAE